MTSERTPKSADPTWLVLVGDDADAGLTRGLSHLATQVMPLAPHGAPHGAPAGSASDGPSDVRWARDEVGAEPERLLRVREQLGQGGQGTVLLAEQTALGRLVAVKIITHSNAERQETLRREGRLAALLDHPHIVPVHDAGNDFLVMKHLQGRTLAEAVKGADLATRWRIGLDTLIAAADALAHAHQRGVVHRDLKPDNLMLGAYGEVWLLDWGLAHLLVDADEVSAICAGTPAFLAPETARGLAAGLRPPVDVWLLGATLFWVLSERAPWHQLSIPQALVAAAAGRIPDLAALAPTAPARLIALVQACCSKHPESRPTAAEIAESLRRWRRSAANDLAASAAFAAAYTSLARTTEVHGAAAYVWLEEAATAAAKATALAPDHPEGPALEDAVQAARLRAACVADDLTYAELLATASTGAHLDAVRPLLRSALRRRTQRQVMVRAARIAAVGALVAVACIGGWWFTAQRSELVRAANARRTAAMDLIRDRTATMPDDGVGFESAILDAERAVGLDPDTLDITAHRDRLRLAYVQWALAAKQAGVAREQLANVPADLRALLSAQVDAVEQATRDAQQERRVEMLRQVLTAPVIPGIDSLNPEVVRARSVALAAIPDDPSDPATATVQRSVLEAASRSDRPDVRAVAGLSLAVRPDLGGPAAALPLLRDEVRQVAVPVSRMVSLTQEPALLWPHLRAFAARDGERWGSSDIGSDRSGDDWFYRYGDVRSRLQAAITAANGNHDLLIRDGVRDEVLDLGIAADVTDQAGGWIYELLPDDPECRARLDAEKKDLGKLLWRVRNSWLRNDIPDTERWSALARGVAARNDLGTLTYVTNCLQEVYAKQNRHADAKRVCEEAYLQSGSKIFLMSAAIAANKSGDQAEANRLVDVYLASIPEDLRESFIMERFYLCLADLGRRRDALEVARMLSSMSPRTPQFSSKLLFSLVDTRHFAEADTFATKLLITTPSDTFNIELRAIALAGLGRLDEALSEMRRLLRADPSIIESVPGIYAVAGHYREAAGVALQAALPDAVFFASMAGATGDMLEILQRKRDDAASAAHLARLLASLGAPRAALAAIRPHAASSQSADALRCLMLSIPALRTGALPGDTPAQTTARLITLALDDCPQAELPGCAPPRPDTWLAAAREVSSPNRDLAGLTAAITTAITTGLDVNDGRTFRAELSAADQALAGRHDEWWRSVRHEIEGLLLVWTDRAPQLPWWRGRGCAAVPSLPDWQPDAAAIAELRELLSLSGSALGNASVLAEWQLLLAGLAVGPQVSEPTIQALGEHLPRVAPQVFAP